MIPLGYRVSLVTRIHSHEFTLDPFKQILRLFVYKKAVNRISHSLTFSEHTVLLIYKT